MTVQLWLKKKLTLEKNAQQQWVCRMRMKINLWWIISLNAQCLTYYWFWLKNSLNWKKKHALNLHCFCFDMLDTLDLRTIISQEAYVRPWHTCICMCHWRLLQTRRVWDRIQHRIQACGIHWEKKWIKYTQMKQKQCNFTD